MKNIISFEVAETVTAISVIVWIFAYLAYNISWWLGSIGPKFAGFWAKVFMISGIFKSHLIKVIPVIWCLYFVLNVSARNFAWFVIVTLGAYMYLYILLCRRYKGRYEMLKISISPYLVFPVFGVAFHFLYAFLLYR